MLNYQRVCSQTVSLILLFDLFLFRFFDSIFFPAISSGFTWVLSKTRICVFAGFWDIAVPTTLLVFVSRSRPAPNCGCWSACCSNLIGSAQWTIEGTLYVAIVFIDPAHRPITKTFSLLKISVLILFSWPFAKTDNQNLCIQCCPDGHFA